MNKIFKILAALIAALMLTALAMPALADVLIEPEDDFYAKHEADCSHDDGSYYTPKSQDGIKVYDEPGGKETGSYPYGDRLYSSWYYTDKDGNSWRYCAKYDGSVDYMFWFREDETLRVYDFGDFNSEHQSEFFDDAEEYRDISKVAFYEYPNGPFKYTEEFGGEEGIHFGECWKDENGKTWGFLGYLYGRRNAWICLDDPANEGLTAGDVPLIDPATGEKVGSYDPSVTPAPKHADDERKGEREDFDPDSKPVSADTLKYPENKNRVWLIVGIVAAAAAACAAVLAIVFKKKKTVE